MGLPENPTSHPGKQEGRRNDWDSGHGCGVVCSKVASSVFIRGRRASGIAASIAVKRRGNGRAGKPKRGIGRRRLARIKGAAKAGATVSASKAGKHLSPGGTGGAGCFRQKGLERLLRDALAGQFHPLPPKNRNSSRAVYRRDWT